MPVATTHAGIELAALGELKVAAGTVATRADLHATCCTDVFADGKANVLAVKLKRKNGLAALPTRLQDGVTVESNHHPAIALLVDSSGVIRTHYPHPIPAQW